MDTLRNKIMNFSGSIYEERMHEKREFYEFLNHVIDEKFNAS